MGDIDREFLSVLAALGSAAVVRTDGVWLDAPGLDVAQMGRLMRTLGCRLVTMTGTAGPGPETTILYHFARPGGTVNIRTATRNGAIASLTPVLRAAGWIEREIHDFFAVDFVGHPNLAPLLRPPELREGFFRDPPSSE